MFFVVNATEEKEQNVNNSDCRETAKEIKINLIRELIKARQERGISQKELGEMSGVKQPIIARMERGKTNPQIDTVIKLLVPLGMTLAIVPLEGKK